MLSDQSLFFLIIMVFSLGLRHGFDLDHIATIDAITRAVKQNRLLAKCVGCLFSLGHGVVVILMSVVISSGLMRGGSLGWLEAFGQWVSIVCLFVFGLLTLWNIVPHSHHIPTTLSTFVFRKFFANTCNPYLIVLIGALFAFSFDTFTQVALFSVSASVMAGCFFSILLGVVFMLGMMASDGLNGLLVASVIQRADQYASIISRVVGLIIAIFSLTLAAMGLHHTLFSAES